MSSTYSYPSDPYVIIIYIYVLIVIAVIWQGKRFYSDDVYTDDFDYQSSYEASIYFYDVIIIKS